MAAVLPTVVDAIDLALAGLQAAQQINQIVQTATADGRTTLTADEWAQVTGSETSAEAALSAAIAKAKAAGT